MGTQEEEREWVDVAKDLLVKCNISLRLRKVTDCDASVFVALYKAILGENVPDYIATPGSQEDDIHNVQSVIDSLALDYLQISLSHITGENVVRGDKDSIKNLLEIFDGLLEYLTEQISEEGSQNEEPNGAVLEDVPNNAGPLASPPAEPRDSMSERASRSPSEQSDVQSSKHSLHSCNVDETESTNELIRLGDSARTFTANQEVNDPFQPEDQGTSEPPQTPNQKEPLNSAIPLRPPYQTTPHRPEQAANSHGKSPTENGLSRGHTEEDEAAPVWTECRRQAADTEDTNGLRSNARRHSPIDCERSVTGIPKARSHEHREQEELPSAGPRRVLLRTQPDVLFLTLQDEMAGIAPLDMEEEEEEEEDQEDVSLTFKQKNNRPRREKTRISHGDVMPTDPLSWRRQKNKQAEQELHHMSEKLSRRLEELDQMLQRALGESGEYGESLEEDKQSHHSDDRMDCQRTQKPTGTPQPPAAHSTHSQSPSPPRERSLVEEQLEGAMREASSGKARSQTNLTATRTHRREQRKSQRQHGQYLGEAYEEELRKYEERKRTELAKERLKAQEAEREYREAILKDAPRTPKASRARSSTATTPHRSPQSGQVTPSRRIYRTTKRSPPMKVKDNDLLPKLLEEFPHLQISKHTLNRMWEQQLGQVEQIHTAQDPPRPKSSKLTSQVKEAQRRHDLLVEIIRKEQQHNKRLRDFKDRIQQQKSSQNRLREQKQQIARAKKYHQDYHVQLRARLMRARTKDERMFKKVFEEGLGIQKERLREQRAEAKEQRLAHQKLQQQEIQSMENYYKDQFSLLAETLALERQEIQVRKKAQERALHKMKRDLRSKMEREIGELQKIIIQNDDEDYFRELEVERLRGRVQMASF